MSWLLLHLHVASMLIRYPVAVLCSYLAFFGFIKIWLHYMISSGSSRENAEGLNIILDIMFTGTGRGGLTDSLPFKGGGGQFDGGGASVFFGQGAASVQETVPDVAASAAETGGGSIVEDNVSYFAHI